MTNKAQNEPLLLDNIYVRTVRTYTVRRIRLNTYLTLFHQYNYIRTYVQQKKDLLVNLCDIVR